MSIAVPTPQYVAAVAITMDALQIRRRHARQQFSRRLFTVKGQGAVSLLKVTRNKVLAEKLAASRCHTIEIDFNAMLKRLCGANPMNTPQYITQLV